MIQFKHYTDLKTAEDFFIAMVHWEEEMEEDFIDCNEDFVALSGFVHWLRGKEYVSSDILNRIVQAEGINRYSTYLQRFLGDYNTPDDDEIKWQLFPLGECDIEAHYKGFQLMAEYSKGVEVMQKRLFEILHEYDYDEEDYEDEEETILKPSAVPYEAFWTIGDDDEERLRKLWRDTLKTTIEGINKRLEDEYFE